MISTLILPAEARAYSFRTSLTRVPKDLYAAGTEEDWRSE
jgi:hypothetical protein